MDKIKYFLYRLQWNLSPIIPFFKPIHLDLEITNLCNQKCIMCWHSGKPLFNLGSMGYDDAIKILNYFRDHGYKSLKLNWRGEPTLHKNLFELIHYAKKIGYIDIILNTNGVVFPDPILINNSGLTKLILSLDTISSKKYSVIHGCGESDHYKLVSNIVKIDSDLGENRKFDIVFNYHISKINSDEFDTIKKYKNTKNIKHNIKYTQNREGVDITIDQPEKKRKKMCPQITRRTVVSWEKNAFPCCVAYNEDGDLYLGNVVDGIDNIIKNQKKFFKKYKNGIIPDVCKNCTSHEVYK